MNSCSRLRSLDEHALRAVDGRGVLVIFDFDGVVADSEVLSLGTLRQTLADFGISMPAEEVRQRFLGTSLESILSHIRTLAPTQPLDDFGVEWQRKLFSQFRECLQPMPGIKDVLDTLDRRGFSYCIASSGTHERIGTALDIMGLSERFSDVFSAEQVRCGKPAPDLFLLACARMGFTPDSCLVIEDSPVGAEAAKAAGMRCLGFVGGRHLQGIEQVHGERLYGVGVEDVVSSHTAIIDTILGQDLNSS